MRRVALLQAKTATTFAVAAHSLLIESLLLDAATQAATAVAALRALAAAACDQGIGEFVFFDLFHRKIPFRRK
jgi:uncharacterized protein YijF (DUF1287 family)